MSLPTDSVPSMPDPVGPIVKPPAPPPPPPSPSPATQPTPPTAPTAPGTNLRNGCQTCPQHPPCDVETLEIVAVKDGKERKLRTDRALRGLEISAALLRAHRKRSDFDEFDLIVEMVGASLDGKGQLKPDETITLRARAEWMQACPDARPHKLRLEDPQRGRVEKPATTPASRPLVEVEKTGVHAAATAYSDMLQPNGTLLELVFGIFELAYSETREEPRWAAVADSCAVRIPPKPVDRATPQLVVPERPKGRPDGTGPTQREIYDWQEARRKAQADHVKAQEAQRQAIAKEQADANNRGPRGELRGLFIIYRQLKVSMKLTLPPIVSKNIIETRDVSYREVKVGNTQMKELTERSPAKDVQRLYEPSIANGRDADNQPWARRELLSSPDPAGAGRLALTTVGAEGIKLEITINERKIDASKQVEAIFRALKLIHQGVEDFKKAIPQVGLRFDFTVEALSGSIEGGFEREMAKAPIDGRLFPIQNVVFVNATIQLFKLKLDCSFGVEIDKGGVKGVAKVGIQIEGKVDGTLEIRAPGGKKGNVTGRIGVEVYGVVEVKVWDAFDVYAKATASTALKATADVYDPDEGFVLRGKIVIEKTIATVSYKAGGIRGSSECKLFEEYEIGKFGKAPVHAK